MSTDSNYVVTGSRDKSVKLWELSTGREVRSFLGHDFSVTSLDVSRDGKYLLTGSNDESVKLWEMETGKEIFSINPPKDGKVTIYELKSYLDDQVPELTRKLKGKPHYPYTFSRGQDFPIVFKQH